jgi:thiol-disulfide isomerase/thioredoxin
VQVKNASLNGVLSLKAKNELAGLSFIAETKSLRKRSVERQRNLLIGIVVGVVVVGVSVYATGLSKLVLSPFRSSSSTYKTSEAATAPDLADGEWINSEPLKLKDLRGRVVLIEFWTFGCYNCRNTLPFIKGWHDRYHDKGLTVIGVHSPESMS